MRTGMRVLIAMRDAGFVIEQTEPNSSFHTQPDEARLVNVIESALNENELSAAQLSAAWSRYVELFGEVPHGTEKQMAVLLELRKHRESAK